MPKVQFPMYLEESEKEEFTAMAKKRHITLTQLIRESLYAVKENPHVLTPSENKLDIDEILNVLEISASKRVQSDKEFQSEILKRLDALETSNQLLMEKAKIPKKKRKDIGDDFGAIFGD